MSLRCIGCGEHFASGEAFDLHATGKRRPERDAPKRCRTPEEMRALGMNQTPGNHAWRMKPRNGSR
jgi:hypothetical protein